MKSPTQPPPSADPRILELIDRVILPALLERFLAEHQGAGPVPLRPAV
jgi:hypothetical protein